MLKHYITIVRFVFHNLQCVITRVLHICYDQRGRALHNFVCLFVLEVYGAFFGEEAVVFAQQQDHKTRKETCSSQLT